MSLTLQPVEQPARRVLLFARHIEMRQASHPYPRAFGPSGSRFGILRRLDPHHATAPHAAGEAQLMGQTAQRHDGAMGERHRLRQAGDTFLQPIEMARRNSSASAKLE